MENVYRMLSLRNIGGHALTLRNDDDFIDRLNHRFSCGLLLVFALVVSKSAYVGEPINCWVPAHFTSNYEDYTNKICWVSNTYYLPIDNKNIPEPYERRQYLSYYQWVPFIFMFQAIFFRIPCFLWRSFNGKVGMQTSDIVETASSLQAIDNANNRDTFVRYIVKVMDRYFQSMKPRKKVLMRDPEAEEPGKCVECYQCCQVACSNSVLRQQRQRGHYLMLLYLFCKFLYAVNAVGQIFLLNAFLRSDYHVYGVEVYKRFVQKSSGYASLSKRFPRVTLCDFEIRRFGATMRHTVQCVLPINLFNESIFIILWFWCAILAIVTFINMIYWMMHMLPLDRFHFVKSHLRPMMTKQEWKDSKPKVRSFVLKYLKADGVLALRIIQHNSSALVTSDIIEALYKTHTQRVERRLAEGHGKEI